MPKTCSISGCRERAIARGWCQAHYQRWRKHGDPLTTKRKPRAKCSVGGCDAWAHGHGYCRRHWLTWRNHGDPEWQPATYEVCTVDGCTTAPRSPTAELCEMHYARLRRTGSLDLPQWRTDTPSYRTAHQRASTTKGKASAHACVDCAAPAAHWSFQWREVSPDAWLWECTRGTWLAYTGEPDDYAPRCPSCARHYDHDFARQGWRSAASHA